MAQNIFNKPSVTEGKTDIIAILDRSGSMRMQMDEAIGGFNAFIDEQKKLPGQARLTTVIFDDKMDVLYEAKPIAEVTPLTPDVFFARGGTHLYDTIAAAIKSHQVGWADTTVVVILTDGQDMYSRNEDKTSIAALIKLKEEKGWTFVFLAANQEAFGGVANVAASMGMWAAGTAAYNANDVGATQTAYLSASTAVSNTRLRSAGVSGQSLFSRDAMESALRAQTQPEPDPESQGSGHITRANYWKG